MSSSNIGGVLANGSGYIKQVVVTWSKDIAKRSDKNKWNRSRVNIKLFRSLPGMPHKKEDTPAVQNDEKDAMFLLWLQKTSCFTS